MVLEYLPTKLGNFWGFVGKYSSTMDAMTSQKPHGSCPQSGAVTFSDFESSLADDEQFAMENHHFFYR